MSLDGAISFVTGGSGGLGRQVGLQLAAAGSTVAIGYHNGRDRAEAICAEIGAAGGKATPVPLDQTDPESVQTANDTIDKELGRLDILVNSAGMASGGHAIPAGDLDAFTPEIWDEMLAVNLRGPYLVVRAAAPLLRRSRWGRVVNLGSTIGDGPWGAAAAYAPSKAAVASLTRFLAAALAPDVTVNCVSPGLMEGTEMSGGAPESFVAEWRDRALLAKTTAIEDVARHVVAFCQSATVTGQVLVVDGGIHFR